MSDHEVAESLKSRENMLRITEARYKGTQNICSWSRQLNMDMELDNSLPNIAQLSGHQATFDYPNIHGLREQPYCGRKGTSCPLRLRDEPHLKRPMVH